MPLSQSHPNGVRLCPPDQPQQARTLLEGQLLRLTLRAQPRSGLSVALYRPSLFVQ